MWKRANPRFASAGTSIRKEKRKATRGTLKNARTVAIESMFPGNTGRRKSGQLSDTAATKSTLCSNSGTKCIRQGVLDLAKVRERASPAATLRGQATWWIEEMVQGHIVHAKKREPIDPNTINSYRHAVTYLNELIGDMSLASIDNPQARTLIAKMKSERRKDGERRFSEKTIVEYFRVLRKVIASALDGNFNPVHHRNWNLAAISLPRVNPKKQRRPTFTAKQKVSIR